MAGVKASEETNVPTAFDDADRFIGSAWNGSAFEDAVWEYQTLRDSLGGGYPMNGRLTFTSGSAFPTADQTAKTTVYLTPFDGDKIALYYNSAWVSYTLTEISASVPATTSTPFDIFCYSDSGTPTLECTSWTNDTTRATALATQNGILVKTGATDRRYIGTGRTTTVSGQSEDSAARRFLWNYYNRKKRFLKCVDTTNSWNYTTATWRAANNDTTDGVGRVALVIGVADELVEANSQQMAYNASDVYIGVGIGVDSTSTNSAILHGGSLVGGAQQVTPANYSGYPAAGYHYIQRLEYSTATGTTTWYGDNNGTLYQSGMIVSVCG